MTGILKVTLILLFFTHFSSGQKDDQEKANCSYFGEPHLIPFPTVLYPVPSQYVCRPVGNELMVDNTFVQIVVTISASGNHPIVQYTVTVAPTGPYTSPCTVTDALPSSFPSISCPLGTSPATVTTSGSSVYISHLTEDIQVYIDNQVRCFDITISQPVPLISVSKGVCVMWKCDLEMPLPGRKKRGTTFDSFVNEICETFTTVARKYALGDVDENLIASRTMACKYDGSMTGDQRFARVIATTMIQDSVKEQQDDDNYSEYWSKAVIVAQQAICEADGIVNQRISESDPICKDQEGSLCFKPVDTTAECSGK